MVLKWIEINSKTFNFRLKYNVFVERKKRSSENFGTMAQTT